ncbi:hypothetical protein [Halorussus salinisoli]|uniref:hypothetical protein n=1 Tax=Halorussus salinisoli TaxID=2558242 RepID=UPI0014857E58|nr:hypothetical protein [Halorussus salinisoli]
MFGVEQTENTETATQSLRVLANGTYDEDPQFGHVRLTGVIPSSVSRPILVSVHSVH